MSSEALVRKDLPTKGGLTLPYEYWVDFCGEGRDNEKITMACD
jgi:hypothetical protein